MTNSNLFFQSEAAELIFYLTQTSGEMRVDRLGITRMHYRNEEVATEWRNNLLKVIHPDVCDHPLAAKATEEVNRFYKDMSGTWKKPTKKAEPKPEPEPSKAPVDPETWDPVKMYKETDGNLEAIREILEQLTLDELKKVIKKNYLDPHRATYRWKKTERLIDWILSGAKREATRGQVFRDYVAYNDEELFKTYGEQ